MDEKEGTLRGFLCAALGGVCWGASGTVGQYLFTRQGVDSGWLTVLPEVVVQDELRTGILVKVGYSAGLQEHFYAITTRHRHRIEVLETLLERSSGRMGPS